MALVRDIIERITGADVCRRLKALERLALGGRAAYLGNGRVVCGVIAGGVDLALLLEADDLLITPGLIARGTYEPKLTDHLARTLAPDAHCIDVGANFGYFSTLIGKLCPHGKAIAVEADRRLFELLRDNLATNGVFGVVTPVHAAVNADGGPMTLHRRVGRSGNTSMLPFDESFTTSLGEPPAERFEVGGVTIDALAEQHGLRPSFIKIDIEGAELLALRGAARTIAANPAIRIAIEWSPGQIAGAGVTVANFLREIGTLGLAPFDIHGHDLTPVPDDVMMNRPYQAELILKRAR